MRLLYYVLGLLIGWTLADYRAKTNSKADIADCQAEVAYWKAIAQNLVGAGSDKPLLASEVGEVHYKANCAICHGATGEGRVGPDIRYSSQELLNLKVLEGRYPKGYKPQRDTKVMPRFPHLASKLPEIHKYLRSQRP